MVCEMAPKTALLAQPNEVETVAYRTGPIKLPRSDSGKVPNKGFSTGDNNYASLVLVPKPVLSCFLAGSFKELLVLFL